MAPAKTQVSKTNYKTYDAQARLLRAIVAAHPEVKWNYKDIAECYGSDMTKDALNHRFRTIRAECLIIEEGRKKGFDMKNLSLNDLPKTQNTVDKKNISTYFGASTGDGIQFQFRAIKKESQAMKEAAENGGDPQAVPIDGGKPGNGATPRKAVTPAKKSSTTTPGSRKRKSPIKAEIVSDDDDDDLEEISGSASQDYSEMDLDDTPSKKTKTGSVQKMPSRGSKTKAASKLNEATSASTSDGGDIGVNPASIFGNVAANAPQAFNRGGIDSFIGHGSNSYLNQENFSWDGDGEI